MPSSNEIKNLNEFSFEKLVENYFNIINEDFFSSDYNVILNRYFNDLLAMPQLYVEWEKYNLNLYRASLCNQVIPQSNIDRFSYPKKNVGINRANIKDHPVFYCCDFPATTLVEINPRQNDTLVIGKWKLISLII